MSLRFAATSRALAEAARRAGLQAPSFRSPPRTPGTVRTLRRGADGSVLVSLVVRDRPWLSVVADMVDGVIAANRLDGASQATVRDRLWQAIEATPAACPPEHHDGSAPAAA